MNFLDIFDFIFNDLFRCLRLKLNLKEKIYNIK